MAGSLARCSASVSSRLTARTRICTEGDALLPLAQAHTGIRVGTEMHKLGRGGDERVLVLGVNSRRLVSLWGSGGWFKYSGVWPSRSTARASRPRQRQPAALRPSVDQGSPACR
jgi:hypothetical protein